LASTRNFRCDCCAATIRREEAIKYKDGHSEATVCSAECRKKYDSDDMDPTPMRWQGHTMQIASKKAHLSSHSESKSSR
jgi:hypothetical protein